MENHDNCSADCLQEVCGNGKCELYETNAGCPQDCNADNLPYSFVIVHEEGPFEGVQEIIDLANQYHVPMTLMFWPGEMERILADPAKVAKVHEWQAQGYEFGIHDQECCETANYDYMNMPPNELRGCLLPTDRVKYEQLAAPYAIKSGSSVCNKWLPDTFIYNGDGRPDGRNSISLKYHFFGPDEPSYLYRLTVRGGYNPVSANGIANPCGGAFNKISQYMTLRPEEIYGIGFHTADYYGYLDSSGNPIPSGNDKTQLVKLFKFWHDKEPTGVKRKTLAKMMEEYVLPNNLVIDMQGLFSSGGETQQKCSKLITTMGAIEGEETNYLNFGRCLHTGTYCGEEGQDSHDYVTTHNLLWSGGMYCPRQCITKSISEFVPPVGSMGALCGNGNCNAVEGITCPVDCPSCGNGRCDSGESYVSCDQDCHGVALRCGDGICDIKGNETKTNCPEDCG